MNQGQMRELVDDGQQKIPCFGCRGWHTGAVNVDGVEVASAYCLLCIGNDRLRFYLADVHDPDTDPRHPRRRIAPRPENLHPRDRHRWPAVQARRPDLIPLKEA